MEARLTKEEVEVLHEQADRTFFRTHFKFLKSHKGFRPKNIHMVLGTSHGGKSTLIRSLLTDICTGAVKQNVLLWLSEETELEFLSEFYRSGINPDNVKNLHVLSELDLMERYNTPKNLLRYIEMYCGENDIGLLFFDNITTSMIYMGRSPSDQAKISIDLKKMCQLLALPFIIIAHTGAAVTDSSNRLIEMNDIRGGKSIVNLAQFFYVLQTFHCDSEIYTTIRITKHRGQEVDHRFYKLIYSRKERLYARDELVQFKEFKEIYKKRNVL